MRSFVAVVKEVPDAKLVILTHCETAGYEDMCTALGISDNVVFVRYEGFNQVQNFLLKADVAVLPRTSWSGFPIKLLNYMAAGKAVVACEGSAKALVHLIDGFVVNDNDVNGFAQGIILLLKDRNLRKRLGENAGQKIRKEYSWGTVSQQVEALYGRILG
jgi:glycosyltransferase involved in cell wall biosynthesis